MRRSQAVVVLATMLIAGCASAPEVEGARFAAASAAAPAESPAAPPSAAIVPDTILDANDLVARTPARPICRDVLKPGSNVHVKRCMSAADWKVWDQIEAKQAGELTRMMQGGKYR